VDTLSLPELRRAATAAYRTDVDGLRGLAITLVCLYHADVAPFSGGFVGVDVFFVISGFVITGVLLRDLERGRFSLKNFFLRRVRRLAPALAAVLLVSVAVFTVLYPPAYLRDFGASLASQSLFASNIYFWRTTGYFGIPPESKPLLHTWSLSIEEQFYLLYATAFVVVGHWRRMSLLWMLFGAMFVSLVLSIAETIPEPNASFFLLPTRAWELLAGAAVAVNLDARGAGAQLDVRLANLIAAAGLAAIVIAALRYSQATPFPYFYALLPVAGAAAITWVERPSLAGALLASPPLVLLGKISYSLYLWHWVAIALQRWLTLGASSEVGKLATVIACVPVAFISWRFIETPIRERRLLGSDRAIFAFGLTATALGALFGYAAYSSGGFPWRARAALSGFVAPTRSPRQHECFDDYSRGTIRSCEIGSAGAAHTSFLVVGDSHALSLLPALDALAARHDLRGIFSGTSGCLPFLGAVPSRDPVSAERCTLLTEGALRTARELHLSQVILVARWNYYTEIGPDGTFQAVLNSHHHSISVGESRAVFSEQLRATVAAYRQIGATISVILQVPQQRVGPEALLYRRALPKLLGGVDSRSVGTLDLAQHRLDQRYAEAAFRNFPGLQVVDLSAMLCERAGTCVMFHGGQSLYFDDNHLSLLGAQYIEPELDPLFVRIASAPS
jgi:peptidoglycan/LPS O-acetylase OafA/YrhL